MARQFQLAFRQRSRCVSLALLVVTTTGRDARPRTGIPVLRRRRPSLGPPARKRAESCMSSSCRGRGGGLSDAPYASVLRAIRPACGCRNRSDVTLAVKHRSLRRAVDVESNVRARRQNEDQAATAHSAGYASRERGTTKPADLSPQRAAVTVVERPRFGTFRVRRRLLFTSNTCADRSHCSVNLAQGQIAELDEVAIDGDELSGVSPRSRGSCRVRPDGGSARFA